MKKLNIKSTQRCTYCKERAQWKSQGITLVVFACLNHVAALKNHENINRDTGYMTEGDRQSWGRL